MIPFTDVQAAPSGVDRLEQAGIGFLQTIFGGQGITRNGETIFTLNAGSGSGSMLPLFVVSVAVLWLVVHD
jgi:hypothetical protein